MDNEVTLVIGGAEIKPTITLPSSSTIGELKRRIMEETGVPVKQQRLLYEDIFLLDNTIINKYIHGAMEEVFLAVRLRPEERVIKISVSNEIFRVHLKVSRVNKVVDLKKKFGEVFGIGGEEIGLWYMEKKMEDDKMLYTYYLNEGSDLKFTRVDHAS